MQPQPDTTSEDNTLTTPNQLADDYRFVERIGEGSQGNVFRALDLRHGGRFVAIKQLRITSVANWKEYDLFQREAQVLSSLDIPGVARFYETREFLDATPPVAFIVQEFIEGSTLATLIASGTRLPVHQICHILIQCLEILQQLHSHDPAVIHRDIKPSNIILTPEGRVYLIDFGAVANPQVQGGGSTVAGTYGYMPPEQMMGRPVPESDVYSLAATAVHLFSGVAPENMEVEDFHLLFEPYMQSMPSSLWYTLRAMLDPDIRKRFCDIPEIIRIFTAFQKGNYDLPEAIAKIQDTHHSPDSMSERAFHKKLAAVRAIRAPGNAELWHRLPNQTPRAIPPCYRNIARSDLLASLTNRSLRMSRMTTESFRSDFALRWAKYCFFIIPLTVKACDKMEESAIKIFFLVIMGILWLLDVILVLVGTMNMPLIFLPIIAVLGIIAFAVTKKDCLPAFEPIQSVPKLSGMHSADRQLKNTMRMIVRYGIKTIATINEIQYVSQPEGIYVNRMTHKFLHTKPPLFKVRYRFNPENDHNPDDLEHVFYTHTPPEGHYSEGDPLPILYYVASESSGMERVYSIPFPLPMEEHLALSYLIGSSSFGYNA